MILKASQRGGGKALALHLLNDRDNEHVTLHDLRGFVSDELVGAFKETEAVSKGTKCKQPFFSLSLSPSSDANVPISIYEDALERIEKKLGLNGQARAVVFHNKEARTHCHAVYSRIDAEEMKAINLAHFKFKLRDISRELYLENDWVLPQGLMNSKAIDPRNYSLTEYQQAKRMGRDPRDLKEMMQECWAASDSKTAFQHALSERGLILAKGRRGHVVVTHEGELLSVARYTNKRAKDVRAKLGDAGNLLTVEEAQQRMSEGMYAAIGRHIAEAKLQHRQAIAPMRNERERMTMVHRLERKKLAEGQRARWKQETQERSQRLNKGLRGLFDRLTGHRANVINQNIAEAHEALKRDREQIRDLLRAQTTDRRELQERIAIARALHNTLIKELRAERIEHHRPERSELTCHSGLSGVFRRQSMASIDDRPLDSRVNRLRKEQTRTENWSVYDRELDR